MAEEGEQQHDETAPEDSEEITSNDGTEDSAERTDGKADTEAGTEDNIREDVQWIKQTLQTIIKGQEATVASRQTQSRPAIPQNRTRVRVQEQAPVEPPPPPPSPRNVKRLGLRGFGLRKARRPN